MTDPRARGRRLRTPRTAGAGLLAALAVLAVALAGTGTVQAATHFVAIVDFAYQPAEVSVTAGESVIWTNDSGQDHTVTADDGSFDSGRIGSGESFANTFDQAGTFAYHCEIHPDQMKGTVVVKAAPVTAAPSGPQSPTPPAGTLPPNFSPFPSVDISTLPPGPSETPTATATATAAASPAAPVDPGNTGGSAALPLLLVIAIAAGAGLATYLFRQRRRTD